MKISFLILPLFFVAISPAIARPTTVGENMLPMPGKYVLKEKVHGNEYYETVIVTGADKDGNAILADGSEIKDGDLLPVLQKDCEKELCTQGHVMIAADKDDKLTSNGQIVFIDHKNKEALVSVDNWAGLIIKLPLNGLFAAAGSGIDSGADRAPPPGMGMMPNRSLGIGMMDPRINTSNIGKTELPGSGGALQKDFADINATAK
jgi:hypothetical protein